MPTPVSVTPHLDVTVDGTGGRRRCVPPSSVNFTALPSRLKNTCSSRRMSPSTHRVGRRRELQFDPLGRRGRHHRFDDVPEQVAQIDLVAVERHAPAGDAREIEQVVDELGLPRRVVVNGLQRARRDRWGQRAVLQQRRPAEHRIERRAQVVRHDRDELVLEPVRRSRLPSRAFCADSYNRARSSACAQCCATETRSA